MTIRFNTAMRDVMVTALTGAISGYKLDLHRLAASSGQRCCHRHEAG